MDKLEQRSIVNEVRKSFLEYSMSVIVARALPDLRDGLKPVHRRILYAMYEDNLTPDKPFRKSATTVGNVLGRYHPHGDSSVYDAMVRMAQDFSYRYPLVDGHGNFGSIDGDGAAAYRYTEARLSKVSLELLKDINRNTVDFTPNFDDTRKEPIVLPSRVPNILINGTMGIAVGMATNIPPHNLSEIVDGCVAYIDNPEIDTLGLMQYIKGPDFPTGATILGNSGIKQAYDTGRGIITIRSKIEIVDNGSHTELVITELPYQVNKTVLQQRIGELVRDKVIDGIADLRDETNLTNGIKVVIVLKKEANANVVLNNLYKHTQLQITYGIILLMLDQGQPKTLGLKDIISRYVDYQREVIIRRTRFDLEKAQDRVHILEGLKIALDNIDEIIKIIRAAKTDVEAKDGLISKFGLDEIQSDAILEMKLRRLTGLEKDKVIDELKELLEKINYLNSILSSDQLVLNIIKEEMLDIKNRYGDDRKTKIDMNAIDYIEDESLIPNEKVVIALTNKGYIKRTLTDTYRTQNRGGVGVKGMTTNDEDFVERIISARTHDFVLFFTNLGKVYRIKGYEIPEFSRQAKGLPIINLLPLEKNENVSSILSVNPEDVDKKYFVFVTKCGLVKKTLISEYESIRKNGKIAILLKENDELISVEKTSDNEEVMICCDSGRMVRFNESEIRSSGRNSAGVKGISMDNGAKVVGFEIVNKDSYILIITERGYGKKTLVDEYRLTHRGSKGVKALNITSKNGKIVAFKNVKGEEELIVVTNLGILIRMLVENISILKRNTQGVRLINLRDEQVVSSIAIVDKSENNETIDTNDDQSE